MHHPVSPVHRTVLRTAPLTLLLVAALGCNAAVAQFEEQATSVAYKGSSNLFTGNQLYEHRGNKAMVRAYVAGVIDSNASAAVPEHDHRYCLPNGGTLNQYADVVVKYLSSNPKVRQAPASSLVRESLSEAFACAAS